MTQFQAAQKVTYHGETFNALGHEGDNWVRISKKPMDVEHSMNDSFVVHKALLTLVDVVEQPPVLKAMNPSVEKARALVKFATDYQTLYIALQKSGYFQNELRTWIAQPNNKVEHFGLLKSMVISKLAKIIRLRQSH